MKINFNKKANTITFYVIVVVFLLFVIYNGVKNNTITSILTSLYNGIKYVLLGIILFYVSKPLFLLFDEKAFGFLIKKNKLILKRVLSSICMVIITIAIVYLVFFLVLPNLIDSLSTLNDNLDIYITNFKADLLTRTFINQLSINDAVIKTLSNFADDILKITYSIIPELNDMINLILNFTYGMVLSLIFAFIYMIRYEEREAEILQIIHFIFKEKTRNKIIDFMNVFQNKYIRFYTMDILNSLVVGILSYLILISFNIEFALLISVLVFLSALIPTFGLPLSAIISCPIVFILNLRSGIIYTSIFIVVLFLDYFFLYKRLLKDLKLSSSLVLIAIVIMTGLFKIIGLFIGVPLFSFGYYLIMKYIEARKEKKKNEEAAQKPE